MSSDQVHLKYSQPEKKKKSIQYFFSNKKKPKQESLFMKGEVIKDLSNLEMLNFMFVGEVNVGKSTIINCLLNSEECPIGIRRTTFTNTIVSCENKKFFGSQRVNLIDTIGFCNKDEDPNNINWVTTQLENVCHLFFVTNYEKCFDTDFELNCFEACSQKIDQLRKLNHPIEMTILINKADQSNNEQEMKTQLSTSYEKLTKKINTLNLNIGTMEIICFSAKNIFNELKCLKLKTQGNNQKFIGYESLTKRLRIFFKKTFSTQTNFNLKCMEYYILKNLVFKKINCLQLYDLLKYLGNDFNILLKRILNEYFNDSENKKEVTIPEIDNYSSLEKLDKVTNYLNELELINNFYFTTSSRNQDICNVIFNNSNKVSWWVNLTSQDKEISLGTLFDAHYEYSTHYKYSHVIYKNYTINLDKTLNQETLQYKINKNTFKRNIRTQLEKLKFNKNLLIPVINDNNRHYDKISKRIIENDLEINENYYNFDYLVSIKEKNPSFVKFGYDTFKVEELSYNFEELQKQVSLWDDLFLNLYGVEQLYAKNKDLLYYLKYKTHRLSHIKQYSEQIVNLNLVAHLSPFCNFYSILILNQHELDYDKYLPNSNQEYHEYNFSKLEKYLVDEIKKTNTINKGNIYETKIKPIKIFTPPEIKEELIILVDRENTSLNDIHSLFSLKGKLKIISFISDIHKVKKIEGEEIIKIKYIGKNSADFFILLYAQELLLTTNKNVVIFSKDHYGECIQNSNRYLHTADKNFISHYFKDDFSLNIEKEVGYSPSCSRISEINSELKDSSDNIILESVPILNIELPRVNSSSTEIKVI